MASDSDAFMSDGMLSEDDFMSDASDVAPVKKKKGGSKAVLKTNTAATNASKGKKKTVEETYQKKSQLEHILLRPDTYIGSVERVTQPMYVLNQDKRIVEREITFTPGLYKIFDEIVVNAADNKQRDPNMTKLEICVDAEKNQISVENNGAGIPVVMHSEEGVYIPTLIFGHLLTGSNFDDDEKKTTGGRNGYGAKLANVFSTEFIVECASAETGKKFRQVFRQNMTEHLEPTVRNLTAAEKKKGDFVKITFSPDLPRFKMDKLDEDSVALLSKRAYDIAGSMANSAGKKMTISLNGEKVPVKNFKEYLATFDGIDAPVAYEKNDRWEIGVAPSPDQTPRQISFVNAICTSKGGQHVSYIADQISNHLMKTVKKKNKGGPEVKPAQIKNNLTVFVNCLVENPAFDSQTKDFLTTRPKAFGSSIKVSDKFLKLVDKSAIVDYIISQAERKMAVALKRKGGVKKSKLTGIPKLDDANHAGTAKSKNCTLIITEGDSAKSLAMSGISVVGRDNYGVFPLRGKPLNVRDVSKAIVAKNAEIQYLVEILGLKYETVYDETNIKTLRYGHLVIMADQDSDGSHIKGLIINFIHRFWPSLLDIPGFLQQFITPIVKVSKGKRSRSFFTLPEYEQWLESTGNGGKGFTLKYYKGLGTSTSNEAKEYFSDLDQHLIPFDVLEKDKIVNQANDEDSDMEVDNALPDLVSSGSDLIDMVFRKTRVEDRKVWLNSMAKDTYMDYKAAANGEGVRYSEFINKEYILFSNYDNQRSIPCIVDGFKPSQRKVLFGCFKRKLKGEVKVAQLTGYIAEHSAYHHGEASLQGTIVNMAQTFVGSNNVNLLTPSGQFGTRFMGGKDAASPRYIFTKLEPITRLIFHPDDDAQLSYLSDDGSSIEPEFYVPVIPMVLVNGADGIGTGWSTTVPNYNPRDIIANLRRMIGGEQPTHMVPFYSGFTGSLTPKAKSGFEVKGRIERLDDTTLSITELPIKKWTQDYKQFIEGMLTGDGKKVLPEIKDFKENHTDTTVAFTITADKEVIDKWEKDKSGLYGKFKLTGSLSDNNMHLFDAHGKMIKYDTPMKIMEAFFSLRLEYYDKRKAALVSKLEAVQLTLSNKARFVEEVCSGELVVSNRKKVDILEDLRARGFDLIDKDTKKKDDDDSDTESEDQEEETTVAELSKGYEYLLGMKIWSLTYEKAEALRAELAEKTEELNILQQTPPSQLWHNDLDAIETALDVRDGEIQQSVANEKAAQAKGKKHEAKKAKKAAAAKKKVTKKKKKDEWDSDMESSDDESPAPFGPDSDDDFFGVPKKTAAAKKAPVKRAPAKKAPAKKPAAVKKTTTTALPPKKTAQPAAPLMDSDSDVDIVSESLMDRMKRKLVVSPPPKTAAPSVFESVFDGDKKRPSPREYDSEDSSTELPPSLPKKADKVLQPSKTAANKSAPAKAKGGRVRKAAAKKAPVFDSDSEDELDFQDSDSEPVKPVAPRARRGGARARVTYTMEEESDSSFSD